MDKPGWIKFYRKTWDEHPNITMTGAWVWLLCAAEFEGRYRGSLVTTISSIAFHWCVTWKKAKNILQSWQEDKMINIDPVSLSEIDFSSCTWPSAFGEGKVEAKVNKGIKINIVNYEKYQGGGTQGGEAEGEAEGEPSGISYKKNKKRNISAKNAEEGKEKKKKKLGSESPHHQEVVDHFHQEFEKRYRKKYVWQTKDFAAIKRLLKKIDANDLKQRISEYLYDNDPFLVGNGHSVALLQTRINAYGKPHFGDKQTKGSGYLKSVY